MLWQKFWMETRWRFLIGLAVLVCMAAGAVFSWPTVVKLMPLASNLDFGGMVGRKLKETVELERTYRGYVWVQWVRQNFSQMGALMAALLGAGGLLSQSLFTFSLPVSRNRLLWTRAATGLAELLVLAIAPSLVITILSPAVGGSYGAGDALVYGICLFVGCAVFFSLALLLSTLFSDLWRPLLIALGAASVLALVPEGIFSVIGGYDWFYRGELPWVGLLACVVTSAALLYCAAINFARHDF
jgi:ABC-2 type transport system permease protein